MRLPAFVCLSVCLLARLLKTRGWIWMKFCVSTDIGTWMNSIAPLYPHRTLWRYTNAVLLLLTYKLDPDHRSD